jgi:catechol 2,3-dioxygenase-like lactoylglutathione lyase family enzyme
MGIRNLDHVGIVVDDLTDATAFFLELGLEVEGQALVEGEWAGKVIGLDDVRSDIVMLRTPDGSSSIELSKFLAPEAESDAVRAPVNRLGLRHIAFIVDDLDGMLARLGARGVQLVGEVQNYRDVFRLCYIRGPEGVFVELAERIG